MTDEALFEAGDYDDWRQYWDQMPAYTSQDCKPDSTINVQFATPEDRRAFLTLLGEDPTRRKSIWYPSIAYLQQSERITTPQQAPPNRYPIYIPTKGRADSRLTIKALEKLSIPYRAVIEAEEFDDYAAHIPPDRLLILPWSNRGLVAARNWIWEHAKAEGHKRHWQLDDNMDGFYRLNDNLKTKVTQENPFASVEDWVDRYTNVPMAGLNYEFFADRRSRQPPLRLNTRIYSCILHTNELTYRFRGTYNDDTDLSLRYLKDGWVTALFNHYLAKKMPTMVIDGGNTPIYLTDEDTGFDGRWEMAEELRQAHPDVVTITRKWDRWQHHVDYTPYRFNQPHPITETTPS